MPAAGNLHDVQDRWLRLILINLNEIENQFWRLEEQVNVQNIDADEKRQDNRSSAIPVKSINDSDLEYLGRYAVSDHCEDNSSSCSDSSRGSSSQTAPSIDPLSSVSDNSTWSSVNTQMDHDLIFREPASLKDIVDAESILAIKLPYDYVQFLLLSNGLKRFPSGSDPGLTAVHDVSEISTQLFNNSSPSYRPNLQWQSLQSLGPICPLSKWFPESETAIRISNADDETYVWLIKPEGMQQAKLHGYIKDRRVSCVEEICGNPKVWQADTTNEAAWGVLTWNKADIRVLPLQPTNLNKPLPPRPTFESDRDDDKMGIHEQNFEPPRSVDKGRMFLYCSFSDYLSALVDSLETAYELEAAEYRISA